MVPVEGMKKKKTTNPSGQPQDADLKELRARSEGFKRYLKIMDKVRALGLPEEDLQFLLERTQEDVIWIHRKVKERDAAEIQQVSGN